MDESSTVGGIEQLSQMTTFTNENIEPEFTYLTELVNFSEEPASIQSKYFSTITNKNSVNTTKLYEDPTYLGCFADYSSDADLPLAIYNSSNMTVQKCKDFCNISGYELAGLQNG